MFGQFSRLLGISLPTPLPLTFAAPGAVMAALLLPALSALEVLRDILNGFRDYRQQNDASTEEDGDIPC
jgi:hypothetical protein